MSNNNDLVLQIQDTGDFKDVDKQKDTARLQGSRIRYFIKTGVPKDNNLSVLKESLNTTHGKADRTTVPDAIMRNLKEQLATVFANYSWTCVRRSLNQSGLDRKTKTKVISNAIVIL
nr:uncharacterized protein LOC124805820 isoform X2 [Hydra vulgaris]